MDQTGTYVNIMRESLERKQRYLTEIWKLTNEQSVIATAEKFDEEQFSELVEKKDVLIDNLNEIDKGFSSVYDRVRIEIQRDPVVYRDELLAIQNLIRTCVDLGMQIEAVEERFPRLKGHIRLCDIGTIIGSHAGQGTVAVFFMGDERPHME